MKCLLLLILATAQVSNAVQVETTPMARVVGLIGALKAKIESDGMAEQKSYDKYACWCEETLGRKANDIATAKETIDKLLAEIKNISTPDVITYNTLMKGYCSNSDIKGARALLKEMEEAGHRPNDVSYNSLLNACVSSGNGNFHDAWETIAMMEKAGVAVDHYTISIMMKALKKTRNPKDVNLVLQLLDRAGLDVCADEILLNTVLETCIRHRETRRLQSILTTFRKSDRKSVV